ncbi:MAG: hypothetical protein K0S85_4974 [Pseudomonas orientalis]|nr:hypothetical protein [Pseudomonas orientalis]
MMKGGMAGLMKQAQQMQEKMAKMQEELARSAQDRSQQPGKNGRYDRRHAAAAGHEAAVLIGRLQLHSNARPRAWHFCLCP